MSAGRVVAGVALVGVLAGVAAFLWGPGPSGADLPSVHAAERPDPAAGRPSRALPSGAAGEAPSRSAAREAVLRMRAEGAGPKVALPDGAAAVAGSPAANGAEMIRRRSERSLRRFDLILKDVQDLLKTEPELGDDVQDIRDQLDEDLADIQARLGAGDLTLQEAHEAVFAAEDLAREALGQVPGDAGKMLTKALPPPPPPPAGEGGDDGWGGQPLEEVWAQ